MDYDAVAAHFLTPGPQPVPAPAVPSSTARRLRDALEPIATIGWWSREAAAAMVGLGHDFFDGYVWGRAASLGADVSAPAVVAAFGVFEPAMLTAVFAHGSSVSSREQILRARAAGAAAGLDAATADLDPLVITRLGDVLLPALADLDCTGRPLFGSLRGLPLPDTPAGRAWRAAELVREHRGDGHLAASVAAGLDAVEMNVLTEVWLAYPVGEYSATRAFNPDRIEAAADALRGRGWLDAAGSITASGRLARDAIEAATDVSQHSLMAALGSATEDVIADGATVSAAILRHGAAPADPRKRAAG